METTPRDISRQLARALQAEDLSLATRLYGAGQSPLTPASHHLGGLALFHSGQAEAGIAALRLAIEADSANLSAVLDLAAILEETNRLQEREALLLDALTAHPTAAPLLQLLGELYLLKTQDPGEHHQGESFYRKAGDMFVRALSTTPDDVILLSQLALCRQRLDNREGAEALLGRALSLEPGNGQVNHSLGLICQASHRHPEAARYFQRAAEVSPQNAESHFRLGLSLGDTGDLIPARAAFERACGLEPDQEPYLLGLGNIYLKLNLFEEAERTYTQLLQAHPDSASVHFNLGQVYRTHNLTERAIEAFTRAEELDPSNLENRWGKRLTLPVLYQSTDEIHQARTRFTQNLNALSEDVPLHNREGGERALQALGSRTNFHLAYQEQNDKALQKQYGQLTQKILEVACPQWRAPRLQRPTTPKIKVGFASAFFWEHTVGKLFNGWLTQLDPARFEISAFYNGQREDPHTEALRAQCHRFVHTPDTLEELARAIAGEDLDVLIFPELGMNATIFQVAGLRLAPLQCAAWGHPVTPGLSTIDYFLSSELMEPADGQDHYNERLVTLPHLSIYYHEPAPPKAPKPREAFGLSPERVVYLCCQSLFKYLPHYDHVFVRIAAEVPNAQLVFLANKSAQVTAQFKERLRPCFEAAQLDVDEVVRILPQQQRGDYLSLNHAADVYLDSLGWSGGNTTLEALSAHLPMVTWAGPYMRSRHTAGILARLGLEEEVAADVDDYIHRAVHYGSSPDKRAALRQCIAERKHRVFQDPEAIRGLEDFISGAVSQGPQ